MQFDGAASTVDAHGAGETDGLPLSWPIRDDYAGSQCGCPSLSTSMHLMV